MPASFSRVRSPLSWLLLTLPLAAASLPAGPVERGPLPDTRLLNAPGDLTTRMLAGIDNFLARETRATVAAREQLAPPPFNTPERTRWLETQRGHLARIIGAIDPREPNPEMEIVAPADGSVLVAETAAFTVRAVRWPVLAGVHGEGLLLVPKGAVRARAIVVPDADQTPEVVTGLAPGLAVPQQYARRLAENGVEVVVPVLADRSAIFSGNETANRWTNLTHREWLYRQSYILGRHVIGYEVQKIVAAADWLARRGSEPVAVVGWGEGGLLALHAAALEPRISGALVSGYFSKREQLWREPIYRNLFGVLNEFGDAELARMIAPRLLFVEPAFAPAVTAPPLPPEGGRNTAAPGRIETPALADVRAELDRARRLAGPEADAIRLCPADATGPVSPLGEATLATFLAALAPSSRAFQPAGDAPKELRHAFNPVARQGRTVKEMEDFSQHLRQLAATTREVFFWSKEAVTTPDAWRQAMRARRADFQEQVIGKFPASDQPLDARARVFSDQPGWTDYEVELAALPGVIAGGRLLVPKGIRPGERRPVVVVQHGLGSAPDDVINPDPGSKFYGQFQGVGTRLVREGFVVFAPRNPYGPSDDFRSIQRRANPLGKSIFSFVIAQHERILDWLAGQPYVDAQHIGFYGLSYGGKTAVRAGAIIDRYAAVVCSGDFNEWIWKNAAVDSGLSYMFTNEYEMPEFNLGSTYSYAEMAAMTAPRPFMVERGHDDHVSTDEWVAFEYAKVARLYAALGIPERTRIEYFNGPHTIHGVGTFEFLHHYLNWPAAKAAENPPGKNPP